MTAAKSPARFPPGLSTRSFRLRFLASVAVRVNWILQSKFSDRIFAFCAGRHVDGSERGVLDQIIGAGGTAVAAGGSIQLGGELDLQALALSRADERIGEARNPGADRL